MAIDLKSYRLAKQFKKESEDFLKAIDLSKRALEHYRHYKPIASILYALKDNEAILKAHLNTAEKILDKKEVNV